MNKVKILLVVLVSTYSMSSFADTIELTVLGGMNAASEKLTINGAEYPNESKTGIAAAAFVGFSVVPQMLMLESGLQYQKESFGFTALATTTKMTRLQIPLLVRFVGLPIVSFGVGGYYEMALGDITMESTAGGATQSFSYDTLGYKTTNYGILLDARAGFDVAPLIKVVLDLRYNIGLANRSSLALTELKTNALQALAGVSFGL